MNVPVGDSTACLSSSRDVDVGSACVDIRQSPKTDVLVSCISNHFRISTEMYDKI